MADILIRRETLSATSGQPLLTDIVKDIIDPNKVANYDLFDGASASINARSLVALGSGSAKVWTAAGLSLDGNGAVIASGTNRVAYYAADSADCEALAVIIMQDVSGTYAGPVVRYVDASNYITAWLSRSGVFAIQRRTAGVTASIASATFTPEIGREYNVRIKASGNRITAWTRTLDGELVLDVINSENPTAEKIGFYMNAAGQKVASFYGR